MVNITSKQKNKMIDLKTKLSRRELTIGSWITIGSPSIAEIMANSGFDWLTIDMEHSAITLNVAQNLTRVIELCHCSPLVRIGDNDPVLIKRIMDTGAHGIIVPMINNRSEAERAVAATKYPPVGMRGVGLTRAQKYGYDFEGYKEWNQSNSIVIVQIEHIDAVNNLEEILSVNGVDGFLVGPYDLSASLGVPGDFDHSSLLEALDHISYISKQLGSLSGYHVIPTDFCFVEEKIEQGYQFIAHSLDILFLGNECRKSTSQWKNIIKKKIK